MLTQCKACAAVNVLDVERAAMGKARCMICRKNLGLPDDDEPHSRSSFPASANLEAAVVDPSKGISEEMETELTPLMPIQKVKELVDITVTDAAIMWNDVTKPDPIRIDIEIAKTEGFDVHVTAEVDPRDIIDTEDVNAEQTLFLDSAEMEDVEEVDDPAAEEPTPHRDFKEATAPFELSRPSEKSRISENLPMVFDCRDPDVVSTVPSIPAAKRHKMSLLAASLIIFALGATDLVSTRANERRLAAATSSPPPTSNWVLVQPAAAPAPPPEQIASALETNTIPVENLPVTVVDPSPRVPHHRAQAKATEGEKLTQAGDLALKRNDLTSARAAYALALASNPSYFPARIGAADVAWASGDQAKAREAYRAIKENYPSDMLPARVFEREVASR